MEKTCGTVSKKKITKSANELKETGSYVTVSMTIHKFSADISIRMSVTRRTSIVQMLRVTLVATDYTV